MKKTAILGIACCALLCCMTGCRKEKEKTMEVANPIPIKFGDPFLLHASDGRYYMYGTSMADGFEAFVSDDLTNWEACGRVYQGGDSAQWCVDCFWAPEVYERDGKYYMFFSANYRENPTNEGENFKIGVAVSDSPAGPFTDLYNRPVFNPEYPIIDANVYFDDATGRCYLYYSRCCYKHPVESELAAEMKAQGVYDEIEESWVYGVELKPDFSGIIGEPQLLLCPPTTLGDPQVEWESRSVTHKEVNRRWTEGSYIFREGDTYYIMYSSNSYQGKYYAVGYATADNPLGPFHKAENNPVLQENVSDGGTVMGTGHCMAVTMPDGGRYCVYHARMSDNPGERVVFMDRMSIDEGTGELVVDGPRTEPYQIKF